MKRSVNQRASRATSHGAILAAILMVTMGLGALVSPVSAAPTDYDYKRPITVSNSAGALTDFQVLVTLDTATLINDGKMRSDCGDARFYDSDEATALTHWLESGCGSTSTKFWVKAPSIPDGGKTIWLYYGNPTKTSQSDLDGTFVFADDFNGAALDTAKWTNTHGDIWLENGYIRMDGTDTSSDFWDRIATVQDLGRNIVVETRGRTTTSSNQYSWVGLYWDGSTHICESDIPSGYKVGENIGWGGGNWGDWAIRIDWPGSTCKTKNTEGDSDPDRYGVNEWFQYRIRVDADSITANVKSSICDWCDSETLTDTNLNSGKLTLMAKYGQYTDWDWIRVREHASPEPTTSVGAEESTGPSAPGEPRNVDAQPTGVGEITVTWDAPASDGGDPITDYKVYRGTTAGGSKSLIATVGDVRSHVDSGLADGTTYYYQVSAVNANGEGSLSGEAGATTWDVPEAPRNLATTASGVGGIQLTWDAPANDGGESLDAYHIYRGTSPGAEVLVDSVGPVNAYTDTGLAAGTTYYYRVSAENAVGEGPLSPASSTTTWDVPSQPQNVAAAPGPNGGEVTITWDAPANDGGESLDAYHIYRGTTPDSPTLLTTVGSATTSLVDDTCPPGTCYYSVSGENAVGEGPASAESAVSPDVEASTSGPYNYVVSPEYMFSGNTNASFDYDVTSESCDSQYTCPSTSEWKIFVGGTEQNGQVSDGDLDGTEVASGTFSQPSHGETESFHVLREINVDPSIPGPRNVKVAVRAIAGDASYNWHVETREVTVLVHDDGDGDGVPDELELQLCGRQIERQILDALGGAAGTCTDSTNYDPPVTSVTLTVPSDATKGPDADEDGFPADVTVHYTKVTVNRTQPQNARVYSGGTSQHTIDPDDNNPQVPVLSYACAPLPVPSGVAQGPDADNDGFTAYVRVLRSQACVDRRYPSDPVELNPAADLVQETVDPDDNDPNMPVVSIIEVENVPVGLEYSRDHDRDGIPGYTYTTYLNVTYDRRSPTDLPDSETWTDRNALDPDDANRDDPVPFSMVDADEDFVPDGAEPWLCTVEDQNDDIDGSCGSGLQDYDPPSWYVMVLDLVWDTAGL